MKQPQAAAATPEVQQPNTQPKLTTGPVVVSGTNHTVSRRVVNPQQTTPDPLADLHRQTLGLVAQAKRAVAARDERPSPTVENEHHQLAQDQDGPVIE